MPRGQTRDLGPCIITFGGVEIGKTKGGVLFRYTEEDKGIYEDQNGVSEVDDINVGSRLEVECPFTRLQGAKIADLIAGASGSGTSGNTFVVRQAVGISRYDRAAELIIKPVLVNGAADPNTATWIHVFKASPVPNFEFTFDNENQRVYKVMFKAYPIQETLNKGNIWRVGPGA